MPTGGPERATPYPPARDHRVATAHVELYWSCRSEADAIQVDGLAVNPWSAQPIRALVVEAVGVDAQERMTSGARAEVRDYQIGTWQQSPFSLRLRATGNETRVDLYYRYWYNEPEMEASLFAGPIGRQVASVHTFTIRDACDAAKHRAR
jgi:hypothetical protein